MCVSTLLPVLIIILATAAHASVKFQPVSAEELKMTSEPLAPGAPAIILYREVDRDDCGITCHSPNVGVMSADRFEEDYFRIKILTEAGRKYGEVEIPISSEVGAIDNINARTIRPDGSVVDFKGQVFEKTILKAKGLKYVAQTFAMPDVQVGSIIEFYYTIRFLKGQLYGSNWILSHELFTKRAKFFLRPFQYESSYNPVSLRWNEHLPPGTPSPTQRVDDSVELEVANIAPFQAEDFMPPENELKARVDFIYSFDGFETDVNKFWKKVGKSRNDWLETFIGRRGAMERAVSQIVSASDTPDVKLHKIYARVQQMRNTTFEAHKTAQEQKREDKKNEETVEDIWKQGYGERWQLNWLCLALARAAGIEAYGVWVSDRSSFFFNPQTQQSGKLDESLVLVKLDGKDVFLAPGAPFTPFGLVPWEETHVQGLRLDKDGGSWIQTSLPESSASRIERKADLKLSQTGNLEGKLMVTYTGLEAQRRRVDERNQDETAHKKFLEDQVKECIPVGSEVELTKQPEWTSSEAPLVAEFDLSIPGWATAAGRRTIFPVEIFGGSERHVFDYSTRSHPIYFEFLSQKVDDVTIALPAGWQITGLPKPESHDLHAVDYTLSSENTNGALHMARKLDVNSLTIDQKYYPPLRAFFQMVRASDEQQVIVEPDAAAVGN
jgi:Domain of Unknown Function with PDB structure (DUF3857)